MERGELILRRRKVAMVNNEVVYEVILNDEFLMSSLFHAAEEALAHLTLNALENQFDSLDIVVGGLGLGYTAAAALEHTGVASIRVVEIFQEIIDWHKQGLVPLGKALSDDSRCLFAQGNFFDMAAGSGFDTEMPERQFHAVLLDIDHTPKHWLHPEHAGFYSDEGLAQMRRHILPGGMFAMWADLRPDAEFVTLLDKVFCNSRAELITFPNPIQGGESVGTVYLAEVPREHRT